MAISLREWIVAAPRGSCKDYLQSAAGVCLSQSSTIQGDFYFFNAAWEEPEFFVTEVHENFKSLR
jgi:hypothetical protein